VLKNELSINIRRKKITIDRNIVTGIIGIPDVNLPFLIKPISSEPKKPSMTSIINEYVVKKS